MRLTALRNDRFWTSGHATRNVQHLGECRTLQGMERESGEAGADLWSRALEGDGSALAVIFDRHSDRIFRHSYALLRNVHDAEDAVAAAFLELWRRRENVRLVQGSVLPWLLVTASNSARNLARSRRRYSALLDSLPRGWHGESAEDAAVAHLPLLESIDVDLADRLRGLSETDYLLVTLTAIEGYSTVEAASALGITPAAARTRLSRARARLRLHHPTERASVEEVS
jgi:RNA polymerase sigma-70 factor, ECF subfamily